MNSPPPRSRPPGQVIESEVEVDFGGAAVSLG